MEVGKVALANQYSTQKRADNVNFQGAKDKLFRSLLKDEPLFKHALNPTVIPEGSPLAGTDFAEYLIELMQKKTDKKTFVEKVISSIKNYFADIYGESYGFSKSGMKKNWNEYLECEKSGGEIFFGPRKDYDGDLRIIREIYTPRKSGVQGRLDILLPEKGVQRTVYLKTKRNGSNVYTTIERDAETGKLKSISREDDRCNIIREYAPGKYYQDKTGRIDQYTGETDLLGVFRSEDGGYYSFTRPTKSRYATLKARGNLSIKSYLQAFIQDLKGTFRRDGDLLVEKYDSNDNLIAGRKLDDDAPIVDTIANIRMNGGKIEDWFKSNGTR